MTGVQTCALPISKEVRKPGADGDRHGGAQHVRRGHPRVAIKTGEAGNDAGFRGADNGLIESGQEHSQHQACHGSDQLGLGQADESGSIEFWFRGGRGHLTILAVLTTRATVLYRKRKYNYLVRVKTSITLPEGLLSQIDREDKNRSNFLEQAALQRLALLERARRDARDARILDTYADRLNQEALDVLEYQDLE